MRTYVHSLGKSSFLPFFAAFVRPVCLSFAVYSQKEIKRFHSLKLSVDRTEAEIARIIKEVKERIKKAKEAEKAVAGRSVRENL